MEKKYKIKTEINKKLFSNLLENLLDSFFMFFKDS